MKERQNSQSQPKINFPFAENLLLGRRKHTKIYQWCVHSHIHIGTCLARACLMTYWHPDEKFQHQFAHIHTQREKENESKVFSNETHQINFNLNLLLLGIQLSFLVVLLFVHCFVLHPLVSIFWLVVVVFFLFSFILYHSGCSYSFGLLACSLTKQSAEDWLDSTIVLMVNGCHCCCDGSRVISRLFPFWRYFSALKRKKEEYIHSVLVSVSRYEWSICDGFLCTLMLCSI